MRFINANRLHRKSKGVGYPVFVVEPENAKCNDGGDYEASSTYRTAYRFPSLLPK
jgi:hypothetical protein